MVKKIFLLTLLCFFTILTKHSTANTVTKYFGINSILTTNDDNMICFKTIGKKENEGLVFTRQYANFDEEIIVEMNLKGSQVVLIKIEETDNRGKFLQEQVFKPIKLTDKWSRIKQLYHPMGNTGQIDVMVLTVKKEKSTFCIMGIEIPITKALEAGTF